MVPVVVGGAKDSKTISIPESQVGKFVDTFKGKDGQIPSESVGISSLKKTQPTHQLSTIGWLFVFFGFIFAGSYGVHKAGGPHKVEAAVDRFFLRAKQAITGGRGRYQGLPR
jgi:hypothetical protein